MTDWSNVTDLEMNIQIMIGMGCLYLFENVEFRNQRYTSGFILSFKIQLGITSYLWAIVSTTENIVEFIYQSDGIFPSFLRAIYLCIDCISDKNTTF